MTPRRLLAVLGGLALLAAIIVGLAQAPGMSRTPAALGKLTPAQMRARLVGSPPPLDALHAQANNILPGGAGALRSRLAALHGFPVVINKWASWCEPCRAELGVFQHASVDFGHRVAFIGIDSGEGSRSDAIALLRSDPVSYPSYYDPSGRLGEALTDSPFTPVTVFYGPDGRQYIHQGPYPSVAKLESDVERYAVHA